MLVLALALIILGIIVLLFGTRLALLGAGIGALLGLGILRLLPGTQDALIWLGIPIGLAVVLALAGGFMRGMISIITLAFGALAGGSIVLAVLDLFGMNFGALDWILALVGAVIGVILVTRFKGLALLLLASLVGAVLTVRGLQILLPSIQGAIATVLGLIVAGGGVAYHTGMLGGRRGAPTKSA